MELESGVGAHLGEVGVGSQTWSRKVYLSEALLLCVLSVNKPVQNVEKYTHCHWQFFEKMNIFGNFFEKCQVFGNF